MFTKPEKHKHYAVDQYKDQRGLRRVHPEALHPPTWSARRSPPLWLWPVWLLILHMLRRLWILRSWWRRCLQRLPGHTIGRQHILMLCRRRLPCVALLPLVRLLMLRRCKCILLLLLLCRDALLEWMHQGRLIVMLLDRRCLWLVLVLPCGRRGRRRRCSRRLLLRSREGPGPWRQRRRRLLSRPRCLLLHLLLLSPRRLSCLLCVRPRLRLCCRRCGLPRRRHRHSRHPQPTPGRLQLHMPAVRATRSLGHHCLLLTPRLHMTRYT